MSLSVFGSNIRMVRMQKGLSVRELAKKVDISYATISNIENSKGSLSFSQRQALCETLNVSLHEMYSTSMERMEVVSRIVELYNTFKVDKLKQAESMCEELIGALEASEERSDLYNLLGKICIMQGEYTKANESYKKSVDDLKETGLDNSMFYYSYYGYALSFYHLKKHQKCIEVADMATSYEMRSVKDASRIKRLISTAYLDSKNLHSAKSSFEELLPLYEEMNDINSLCELNINLGYMYYLIGELYESEHAYKKAFEYALQTGIEEYIFRSGIALLKHFACSIDQEFIEYIKRELNNKNCPVFLESQYLFILSKSYEDKTEQENSLLLALYKSQDNKNIALIKEISEELMLISKRKGDLERALQFAEMALNSSNIINKQYEREFYKK